MVINEFQMSLIGAGAGLVIAVWLYNVFQERKHRRAAEAVFKGAQRDVLLDQAAGGDPAGQGTPTEISEVRQEPVLGDELPQDSRVEPSLDSAAEEIPGDEPVQASVNDANDPDESLADRAIEAVIGVRFAVAVPSQRLWQAVEGLNERILQNFRWAAHGPSGWRQLTASDAFSIHNARALMQLADRQGPVTELDLVNFITAIEKLAEDEGGDAQVPPVDGVLEHARALDDFCASIDIQLSVHLVSRSGSDFPGTKLRGIMEANGFALGEDGQFSQKNENGVLLLSVSNIDGAPFRAEELKNLATHGVTFWLDVPRTPEPVYAYDRMLTIARQLGEAVDGVLVDDQHQPLAETMLGSIRTRIQEIQQKMKASDLPAGGRRALRLFR